MSVHDSVHSGQDTVLLGLYPECSRHTDSYRIVYEQSQYKETEEETQTQCVDGQMKLQMMRREAVSIFIHFIYLSYTYNFDAH